MIMIIGGYHNGNGVLNRLILGLKRKDGKIADHVNHNTLDNRRHNLRVVTPSQNQMNRRKVVGFRWCKPRKKWVAYIMLNYKSIHLGYFLTKKKAEQAYLEAKKVYHKIA